MSSASLWYSQGYIETIRGVKKGEKAWHIGLGAGFEANCAAWRALRDIHCTHNAWKHVIGREDEAVEAYERCCSGGIVALIKPVKSCVNS